MKFGIVRFPGSNCDFDCLRAVRDVLGQPAEFLWHEEEDLKNSDCVVLPGGFSYGDYLRSGAIAHLSPIMKSVRTFAQSGGIVIGICNGFQILTEAGLLPGALMMNNNREFICKDQYLKVENNGTIFTGLTKNGQILNLPIAHGDGRYYADEETLKKLNKNGQVILRYSSPDGVTDEKYNPNGSAENIAGICDEKGKVFGLMPHPERACEKMLGSDDGLRIFGSVIKNHSRHRELITESTEG